MRRRTPREIAGERIREEIFGSGINARSPARIAEATGFKLRTVQDWQAHPSRIRAVDYLIIMNAINR